MDYPVLDILPNLKKSLSENRIVILQAPPGAGKSTILPLKLLDEPWLDGKKMIMLEPRRLAAKSVAERMSQLRDEGIGDTVGYRVRFDTKVSNATTIEVVTEGILTRMIQTDSSLDGVGLVIFDEFHERSLHADLALALSLQIRQVLRSDLRLLIMSATIDASQIASVLGGADVLESLGKQFPVDIRYQKSDSDSRIEDVMSRAIRMALCETAGDILAFLPGVAEIRRTMQLMEDEGINASVLPLYGELTFKQQQEAIVPLSNGQRKVVLATSIAETSLTIQGITTVIDSGLSRVPKFDPRSGLTRLETLRVTKDAADQRAGRAGRLGPGVCYRLWTEATQRNLLPNRKPEIVEADLATMILELANWGIKDVKDVTWITPPPPGAVAQAKSLLTNLDALDDRGVITSRGKEMLSLPTHPRISHLLLSARNPKEKSLVSDIAALLEERDPLGKGAGADLGLRVEALRAWRRGEKTFADRNILERIERLAANWRKLLCTSPDNEHPGGYETGRFVIAAYPERIARQQSKRSLVYTLANGRVAKLPDHDPLMHEPWICASQLDAGQREGKIFAAAAVSEEDLMRSAAETQVVKWDEEREMVAAVVELRAGTLVLKSRPAGKADEDQKNQVLLDVIREKGLRMLGWNEEVESLRSRMQSLCVWRPTEGWSDVSDESLLNTLEQWLTPYLTGIYKRSELEKLDLKMILVNILPWEKQSKLDEFVPARMEVPSGSMIRIDYFADGRPPVMEVRLQEMFGLLETPVVNGGRTKILLHLLSPGYKPVQVTQDLRSFWQTTYHEVRKELRMRYPKHSWPEDPFTAVAVRGAKRRNP
ncbi:MAG TPA: ATP-dependent helicase HrpB [Cyclobacteriaceae bacterium]|nr:ATP-dependent helicase HrpB [Cyclobacteriaceae bacterium]